MIKLVPYYKTASVFISGKMNYHNVHDNAASVQILGGKSRGALKPNVLDVGSPGTWNLPLTQFNTCVETQTREDGKKM